MSRNVCLVIWLASAVGMAAGCQKEQPLKPKALTSSSRKAQLPPPPNLDDRQTVSRYADGSYAVEGLLRQAEQTLHQTVTVKGYVVDKLVCDPTEPTCRKPPHALIADTAQEKRRTLLVVGESDEALDPLQTGNAVTLTGMFDQVSPDGRFIRDSGLLVLPRPTPPPTPDTVAPDATPAPAPEKPATAGSEKKPAAK